MIGWFNDQVAFDCQEEKSFSQTVNTEDVLVCVCVCVVGTDGGILDQYTSGSPARQTRASPNRQACAQSGSFTSLRTHTQITLYTNTKHSSTHEVIMD